MSSALSARRIRDLISLGQEEQGCDGSGSGEGVISRRPGIAAHRSLLAGFAALAILVGGLVLVFVHAGFKQDEKANVRERQALLASLRAHESLIRQVMLASQDERATLAELSSGNLLQFHRQFGRKLNEGFGFEFVYITDAKGNLLYSSERGGFGDRRAFAWIGPAIERAVTDGQPVARSGVVAGDDEVGIMVAHPFTETNDTLQVPQPLIVVTVDVVDGDLLQSLAVPANVHDLKLIATSGHDPAGRIASAGAFVPNLSDGSEAELVWTGPQPGRSLMRTVLPALTIISTLLAVVFLVLMLRARRVVAALAESEARARELAATDHLTGLANRGHFIGELEQALAGLKGEERLALLFVDLDDFKAINDTAGHEAGDALLCEVGERLRSAVGAAGLVGRFGGDEFVAYSRLGEGSGLDALLDRVTDALKPSIVRDGETIRVQASVGTAEAPRDGRMAGELLRRADVALYRAKEDGGGVCRFAAELESEQKSRREIAAALTGVMERGELLLIYQPEVEVASGRVVGFETLLRWDHPALGRLLPARFIAVAEEMHLIGALDFYTLRRACVEAVSLPGMTISVNMSATTLRSGSFPEQFQAVLEETRFDPKALEIEVTEESLLRPAQETERSFAALRASGVRIALDDFGSGSASLVHVHRFPVTRIKLDRSLMLKASSDPDMAAVIQHKLSIARSLGLDMTAEGVETREQLRFLREIGMPTAQGYLFAPPLPIAAAIDLLRRQDEGLPVVAAAAEARGRVQG